MKLWKYAYDNHFIALNPHNRNIPAHCLTLKSLSNLVKVMQ